MIRAISGRASAVNGIKVSASPKCYDPFGHWHCLIPSVGVVRSASTCHHRVDLPYRRRSTHGAISTSELPNMKYVTSDARLTGLRRSQASKDAAAVEMLRFSLPSRVVVGTQGRKDSRSLPTNELNTSIAPLASGSSSPVSAMTPADIGCV